MPSIDIRPMLGADVASIAESIRRDSWGDREAWFAFATTHPMCAPFVAVVGGDLVGTGVATANGRAGWIGTIWVRSDHRGRGLGRDLTRCVIEELEDRGCSTLLLVASSAGRPLYEKLGFAVQTHYQVYDAPAVGVGGGSGGDGRVRPFRPADIDGIISLDARATGEDRGHLLRSFASADTTRCLDRDDGALAGFLMRAPWGGGATIALDPEAGLTLVEDRRTGSDRPVRTGLPTENRIGRARLEGLGWTPAWESVRMSRGPALDWEPGAIWGQFNYAVG